MSRADKKDKAERYFRGAADEPGREERTEEMNRLIFSAEYSFTICSDSRTYLSFQSV